MRVDALALVPPPKAEPLHRRLRLAWRLYRATPDRPLSRDRAREAMALFRLAADGIPAEHRELWLIEEGRAAIALTALELQAAPWQRRSRLWLSLGLLHVRLSLLLKALEQVRISEPRT